MSLVVDHFPDRLVSLAIELEQLHRLDRKLVARARVELDPGVEQPQFDIVRSNPRELHPLVDTYGHYIDGKWVEPDSGRYDDIGRNFGRARPATGFSIADLREAAQLAAPLPAPKAIAAPHGADPQLNALVDALRSQGQIVVRSGDARLAEGGFELDREIRLIGARWQVVARTGAAVGASAEARPDGR